MRCTCAPRTKGSKYAYYQWFDVLMARCDANENQRPHLLVQSEVWRSFAGHLARRSIIIIAAVHRFHPLNSESRWHRYIHLINCAWIAHHHLLPRPLTSSALTTYHRRHLSSTQYNNTITTPIIQPIHYSLHTSLFWLIGPTNWWNVTPSWMTSELAIISQYISSHRRPT